MEDRRLIDNFNLKLQNTYVRLPDKFYTKQYPEEVPNPILVAFNDSLADMLGLDKDFLESSDGIAIMSGNGILEGTTPIAEAYAGHQFGYFTMLGDGRAVLLGEVISETGERYDIQLKGSGRTRYSRGGDGKASLGPMLREYIISEGMYGLRIPTTRSLAVVLTGENVIRENVLPGAVLTRIAQSHIRVGTFQYAAEFGDKEDIKALADYVIKRHYKEIDINSQPYYNLLKEVVKKQAQLIAKWQCVGFIHGVMNTDNVSISGETIDYGPCAFMDTYNLNTVFSSIDREGRYAYGNQPKIGAWNLARFAESLLPLFSDNKDEAVKMAEEALNLYSDTYFESWYSEMRRKLGLYNKEEGDKDLIKRLLNIMEISKADYTNTFLNLTIGNLEDMDIFKTKQFEEWHQLWMERLQRQNKSIEEARNLMKKSNPVLIPRNHRVEEALEAAVNRNDYSVMNHLLHALKNPFDYDNINEYYTELPPKSSCGYKTFCGT